MEIEFSKLDFHTWIPLGTSFPLCPSHAFSFYSHNFSSALTSLKLSLLFSSHFFSAHKHTHSLTIFPPSHTTLIPHNNLLNNTHLKGIQCYYMMIRRKLKTLNELKIKIMEELQVNPTLHDIHITFRSPHEVLNQCINYRYMAIKEDKHVKIMFSMMQKWEQVANIELYVTLEPHAEVSVEEIIQTTTSLQVAVLDNRCITLGGYTPPFQETQTTIESEPSNRFEDQFCTHRGESSTLPVVEDEDCFGEDLDNRNEYEERIERDDFDRGVDDHEITPNPHVDDMAECDEDDADAAITVQHVTNTPPVYEPPASSFYANT
ncbi:hypothetical protein SO802_002658 [Lithocarpus litseifolius]|uniref:Uncharacterized protein n=1 Tax=Lithocarpus litseifolius TaxID=425828 RepID=A0AAW2DZJ3_9ROSI